MRPRLYALIVAAGLTAAVSSYAQAARPPVKVAMNEKGFVPAVVVVAPGTTVRWQNTGAQPHSLIGQVHSPDLSPGQSYQRRFTIPGQYEYRDGHHPDNRGTVIVTGGGSGSAPSAHGNATYHYTAKLKLTVSDKWTYYDSRWQSTKGPCNAQVGTGDREVELSANFSHVTYERFPSAHVELLFARDQSAKFGSTTESVDSFVATHESPLIDCSDGTTDREATQPANCGRNFTDKPAKLNLSWTSHRFLLTNNGPAVEPRNCTNQIDAALGLVGVKPATLPLDVLGSRVDYDTARTSPATAHELGAMRSGHSFTIGREVRLDFTTTCCEGFNPGHGGVPGRVGSVHSYSAKLVIRFTRHG